MASARCNSSSENSQDLPERGQHIIVKPDDVSTEPGERPASLETISVPFLTHVLLCSELNHVQWKVLVNNMRETIICTNCI